MGKAGTDPCFLKLTVNGVVETQGYGQGSGGYYFLGRGQGRFVLFVCYWNEGG